MTDRKTWEAPKTGERVILRGRDVAGTLGSVDNRGWALVDWDTAFAAPVICHIRELEPAQG